MTHWLWSCAAAQGAVRRLTHSALSRRRNKRVSDASFESPTASLAFRVFSAVAALYLVAALAAVGLMALPIAHGGSFANCVYACARLPSIPRIGSNAHSLSRASLPKCVGSCVFTVRGVLDNIPWALSLHQRPPTTRAFALTILLIGLITAARLLAVLNQPPLTQARHLLAPNTWPALLLGFGV